MSTDNTPVKATNRLTVVGSIIAILVGVFTIVQIITKQPLTALIVSIIGALVVSWYFIRKGYVIETIVAWLVAIVIGLVIYVLLPRAGTVTGTISAGEIIVSNEQVRLIDAVGVEHKTKTDKDGHYEFKGIPWGKFIVQAGENTSGGKLSILVPRIILDLSIATPTSTQTALLPTSSEIPATIHTPTSSSTPSQTQTLTPTPLCPYAADTDDETIQALIAAEAEAVNRKSIDIILAIFSSDAVFTDYAVPSGQPPHTWFGPIARYKDDLFKNTDLSDVVNFDILPAGPGILGDTAYYTSGSKGSYRSGDKWVTFFNGSKVGEDSTPYGSNHWTLHRNSNGCWVIARFDFNAGHIPFPP